MMEKITRGFRRLAMIMAILLFSSIFLGCQQKKEVIKTPNRATEDEEPKPKQDIEIPKESVTLYFIKGEKLFPVKREVIKDDVILNTLKELLKSPTVNEVRNGADSAIPTATKALGLKIKGSITEVNLSSDFETGGGSLSMQLRVAQIVYTLDQFEEITKVKFFMDGKEVEALGGEGIILDKPVDREDLKEFY